MSLSANTGSSPSDLSVVLELIASPAALKAKMAEYAAAKKAAEDAVAQIAPAKDIPRLRAEAAKDRAVAAEELAAVRANAQGIGDQARATADAVVKAANEKAEAAVNKSKAACKAAEASEAAAVKAAAELNALSLKHDAREKAVTAREAVMAGRENDLAKDVAAHKQAVAVLKGVRESLIAQHNEHLKALSV